VLLLVERSIAFDLTGAANVQDKYVDGFAARILTMVIVSVTGAVSCFEFDYREA